jgi:hypothetical protein
LSEQPLPLIHKREQALWSRKAAPSVAPPSESSSIAKVLVGKKRANHHSHGLCPSSSKQPPQPLSLPLAAPSGAVGIAAAVPDDCRRSRAAPRRCQPRHGRAWLARATPLASRSSTSPCSLAAPPGAEEVAASILLAGRPPQASPHRRQQRAEPPELLLELLEDDGAGVLFPPRTVSRCEAGRGGPRELASPPGAAVTAGRAFGPPGIQRSRSSAAHRAAHSQIRPSPRKSSPAAVFFQKSVFISESLIYDCS